MEQSMRKRWMQFAAAALAVLLFTAGGAAVPRAQALNLTRNSQGQVMIRVGLASSSSHNALGELAAAHLQNNTGYGAGFRFGYYDSSLNFVELGRTSADVTEIAVLKTQNLYYGRDPDLGKDTYTDAITSSIAVGCYHIRIPGSYSAYEDAAADAALYGGFVAWIDGAYQVRVGAYFTKEEAQTALNGMSQGTIVGTSSYGMSVVKTGTSTILFQYDCGSGSKLGILPDVTGASDVRTWFSGPKYRGGFTYQRVSGGDLTVVNVLDLENYIKGVVCYEMGREWPLEALKAQAICARTYVLQNLGAHNSLGFDICNSTWHQVYGGVGTTRTDYGASATSDRAVEETAGMVLWYKGSLAETYYSSCHGGASEEIANVWTNNKVGDYPYLCGVVDPYESYVDDRNPYSSWTVSYTSQELTSRLQQKGYGMNTSVTSLTLTYSQLGNVIGLRVHYANGQSSYFTPTSIRSVFDVLSIRFTVNGQTVNPAAGQSAVSGQSSAPSQDIPGGSASSSQNTAGGGVSVNGSDSLTDTQGLYVISGSGTVSQAGEELHVIQGTGETSSLDSQETPDQGQENTGSNQGGGTVEVSGSSYVFNGSGNGHQLGMSQFGANAMARQGFTGEEIVEFYFPGTNVSGF